MPNVSVSRSIIVFHDTADQVDETIDVPSDGYLQSRELAERAAADNSQSTAAESVHEQLASLYSARLRGARGSKHA